jgi:predicted nucleic acid-binding protein
VITAVDTDVLIDVFAADPEFGPRSREQLRICVQEGGLVACDVVWAEVAAGFPDPGEAREAMTRLGVRFVPLDEQAARAAGGAWRHHRERGGDRRRVIADVLIGAHAGVAADRLLTRDRGFYRSAFAELAVLDPTEP